MSFPKCKLFLSISIHSVFWTMVTVMFNLDSKLQLSQRSSMRNCKITRCKTNKQTKNRINCSVSIISPTISHIFTSLYCWIYPKRNSLLTKKRVEVRESPYCFLRRVHFISQTINKIRVRLFVLLLLNV